MLKKIFNILDTSQKKYFLVIVLLVLVGTVIEVLSLSAIYKLIQSLLSPITVKDITFSYFNYSFVFDKNLFIKTLSIILIVIYFVKFIFFTFLNYFQFNFVNKLRYQLSKKLLNTYTNLKYTFFTNNNSSKLLRNVDKEISFVADGVILNFIYIITETIIFFGILIFLFYIDIKITSILLISLISFSLLIFLIVKKKIINLAKLRQSKNFEFLKAISNNIKGIKEIKIFNKENYFIDIFSKSALSLAIINTKLLTLYSITKYAIEFIAVTFICITILLFVINDGSISNFLLMIGLYLSASIRIIPSANRILSSIQKLNSCIPSLNLINDELNQKFEINVDSKNELINFEKSIKFDNISFRYLDKREFYLDSINFEIKKNNIIAVVGKSGSGKTTLIDIIVGLLQPDEGKILIDGIEKTNFYSLIRHNVSYLSQNFFLMDDTIKNNIIFGSSNFDRNKFDNIIERLELKSLITNSKDAENTVIGEDGLRLSGGQAQRIGLARCLYSKRNIIVLDEATSALDEETENSILSLINTFKNEKTIIFITHRNNVSKYADTIYIMKNGKIKKLVNN